MSNGRRLHREHNHSHPAEHGNRLQRLWAHWKRWLGVR